MMQSQYSKSDIKQAILTLENVEDTINRLIDWNNEIFSTDF